MSCRLVLLDSVSKQPAVSVAHILVVPAIACVIGKRDLNVSAQHSRPMGGWLYDTVYGRILVQTTARRPRSPFNGLSF